jgi:DNA-binding MarR family transcriptional regulator
MAGLGSFLDLSLPAVSMADSWLLCSFQAAFEAEKVSYALENYIVLRYNKFMNEKEQFQPDDRLQVLAEFRHRLRLFLQFSETAAQKAGLQPQQHQLLLQIAGAPEGTVATVGYVAERLGLRHNTAVELSNRCEEAGLIARKQDGADRRCVILEVTRKGRKVLDALSVDHARELNELGPQLIRALTRLRSVDASSKRLAKEEL